VRALLKLSSSQSVSQFLFLGKSRHFSLFFLSLFSLPYPRSSRLAFDIPLPLLLFHSSFLSFLFFLFSLRCPHPHSFFHLVFIFLHLVFIFPPSPSPSLVSHTKFSLSFSFPPLLAPLLLRLLRSGRRRRRRPLQVLHLAFELAPVLQFHDAPSGVGVEPRHDAPLLVHLLRLEAM
jgi:hypothetical protein